MNMPSYSKKVKIPGKSAQELYSSVSDHLDLFLDKVSLGNYKLERRPERSEIEIKSSLFTATLHCSDSMMTLNGNLSLLALPLKGKIDTAIDRWLSKTFNLNLSAHS
jgi:hypothetical protein